MRQFFLNTLQLQEKERNSNMSHMRESFFVEYSTIARLKFEYFTNCEKKNRIFCHTNYKNNLNQSMILLRKKIFLNSSKIMNLYVDLHFQLIDLLSISTRYPPTLIAPTLVWFSAFNRHVLKLCLIVVLLGWPVLMVFHVYVV